MVCLMERDLPLAFGGSGGGDSSGNRGGGIAPASGFISDPINLDVEGRTLSLGSQGVVEKVKPMTCAAFKQQRNPGVQDSSAQVLCRDVPEPYGPIGSTNVPLKPALDV